MNKKCLFAALLLGVAGVQTAWAQKVVLHFPNGDSVKYPLSQLRNIEFEEASDDPVVDGHGYVDLGLPSGTRWATCNVGADTPEEYGGYYAWGETIPNERYDWRTYTLCNGTMNTLTKYVTTRGYGYNGLIDNKTELEPEDDAATVNWSSKWQMPIYEQMAELVDTNYVTTERTTQNDVAGLLITSKSNGKSLFLPAAGRNGGSKPSGAGTNVGYWSRSLASNTTYAHYLNSLSTGTINVSRAPRYYGLSVRPVLVQGRPYEFPVTAIKLNYDHLELGRGTSEKLRATVLPGYARNTDVIWTSSDETVATVNNTGTVVVTGEGTCTITCTAADGSGVTAECVVTVDKQGTTDGHQWVDLGLPSATLWATCNIGAEVPEDYGHFIAWGETQPKESYDFRSYQYYDIEITTFTKYCINRSADFSGQIDGRTWLQAEDDAATANWGSRWQMPSREQFEELINSEYTTAVRAYRDNKAGLQVTSLVNGNSIFMPAGGMYMDDSHYNENYAGEYWSRSLFTESFDKACYMGFAWQGPGIGEHYRPYGMSIRPVRYQEVTYVSTITLKKTALFLEPGQSETIVAVVSPADAANTGVTWESNKSWVASVDAEGNVTAGSSSGSCVITCRAADGSGVYAECQVTVVGDLCPNDNHPHTIDLGLPSGTKWCCCNVGASTPTEYGGYYAWGETSEKDDYDTDNYDVNVQTDISGTSYDVARVKMGAPWRMPSSTQIQELLDNCSYGFMTKDGVFGLLFTGTNGKQIFLPAAGNYWLKWNDNKGTSGDYWTSTPNPDDSSRAIYLRFSLSAGIYKYSLRNCEGKSVRAVR